MERSGGDRGALWRRSWSALGALHERSWGALEAFLERSGAARGALFGGAHGTLWNCMARSGRLRSFERCFGSFGRSSWQLRSKLRNVVNLEFQTLDQIYTIFLHFQEYASCRRGQHICFVQLQFLLQNGRENSSFEFGCCRSCESDFVIFGQVGYNFPYRRRLRIELRNFGSSHSCQSNTFSILHI